MKKIPKSPSDKQTPAHVASAKMAKIDTTPPSVMAQEPSSSASSTPTLSPTRYGDWEKNGRCIDF